MGHATNNKAELSALWTVLKIAKDKQVPRIHIFGDSKTTIDCVNGKRNIRAPHLHYLLKEIQALKPSFESVSFSHIYRELNTKANTLSKLALAIQLGFIEGEEHINDQVSNFFIRI